MFIGRAYALKGGIYQDLNQFGDAISMHSTALNSWKRTNDPKWEVIAYFNTIAVRIAQAGLEKNIDEANKIFDWFKGL